MKDVKNKKIVILGMSRSGYAAAILAAKKKANVFVTEVINNKEMRVKAEDLAKRGICVELGGHTEEFFKGVDFFITSPGIKSKSSALTWARRKKINVFSEIEFASWFCPAPIIAVTGSNGKTTVVTLLGEVFRLAGKVVVVCGNIGNPFSGEYSKFKKADIVVLEVSSFQLESIKNFRPRVSIILNITQNHFDHHRDMKEYANAKSNILKNQRKSDISILNFDDQRVFGLGKKTKTRSWFLSMSRKNIKAYLKISSCGCFYDKDQVWLVNKGSKERLFNKSDLEIGGDHNIENAMAVFLGALALKASKSTIVKSLKNFKGLEHRCEKLSCYKGINFVNDSKSTTVDATFKALSMFKDKSVHLICGGRDKGSNFKAIKSQIKKKVATLICIGEARSKIANELKGAAVIKKSKDLQAAVNIARLSAKKEDTVLLSPMCASFDMFDSFNHRGKVFKKIVKGLRKR
ncbi:MAG: UDP-N-acetylmuramoyl-L-alanine--D-glutamate ligase [Candidatus Omnitrophica bacterium]|nr:UDP-N-acetylmuramoyl-L-alanine--D-glutamate ligase [Candidatus Omnitrophota bacterium]